MMQKSVAVNAGIYLKKDKNTILKTIAKHKLLYIMMIPGIIFFIIYRYLPLFGVVMAFQDYNIIQGVLQSPWVGFKHFETLLTDMTFWNVFKNTVVISTLKLIFGFPAPIILALFINELGNGIFKRVVQSISCIPNFLSWAVMGGIFIQFFYGSGLLNNAIIEPILGHSIDFFAESGSFRNMIIITDIWKSIGWSAIIYTAALAGVDPELYEAAILDGASRFKQIIHITLPSISSIITIMLIFSLGGILNAGFDQILVMYNSLVYSSSDIIDTYVYRMGLQQSLFSYSTAVGLFKSLISATLVLGANKVVKALGYEGIW